MPIEFSEILLKTSVGRIVNKLIILPILREKV